MPDFEYADARAVEAAIKAAARTVHDADPSRQTGDLIRQAYYDRFLCRVEDPANRLTLPRLVSYPYRLYPVADQVADKVCATIADYSGRPSSREKDLVDLVVIAVTQTVDAASLRQAIATECAQRRLQFPIAFTIPAHWGPAYARLARNTPAEPYGIIAACELMHDFIDPVLLGRISGAWDPETRTWA